MVAVVSPSFLARRGRAILPWGVAAALAVACAGVLAQPAPPAKVSPAKPASPAAAPLALAFELVTPTEAKRDRELRPKTDLPELPEMRTRSLSGAGTPAALAIRVVAPTSQAAVPAPLRIELAFDTPPGARIVPSSFRVLYGVLKIDLTDRLRRFSTINERGVVVDQAVVPDGLHRLFLQVSDDKGNLAEQELRLRVGVAS